MEQNRFKSKVFWVAVAAQILSILVLTGVIDTGTSDVVTGVITGVLQLLVVLGVLNNPTDSENL